MSPLLKRAGDTITRVRLKEILMNCIHIAINCKQKFVQISHGALRIDPNYGCRKNDYKAKKDQNTLYYLALLNQIIVLMSGFPPKLNPIYSTTFDVTITGLNFSENREHHLLI